jgi:hypothetical protein
MKRLLLASILMAFGASAQATVTVDDPIECPQLGFICSVDVACSNGDCVVNNTVSTPAGTTCAAIGDPAPAVTLSGTRIGSSDPVCEWEVTDGDDTPVTVTLDGSVGFPVELQSLSVE